MSKSTVPLTVILSVNVVTELTVNTSVFALPIVVLFPFALKLASNMTAEPTSKVPLISVSPLVDSTVNLSSDPLVILKYFPVVSRVMSSWNVASKSTSRMSLRVVAPSTSNVLFRVVPPSTSRVPSVWVFPLSVSTSNTLTPAAVWISNFLLSAFTIRLSVISVSN